MDVILSPLNDPVGEALHVLRMSGTFYCRSEFTAPWALDLPAINSSLMLHAVLSGQCRIEVAGSPVRLLQSGDLTLVTHGRGHQMASHPGVSAQKLFDTDRQRISDRYELLRMGGGGEPSTMICGLFQFEHPAAAKLVEMLPGLIVVERAKSHHLEWIHSTLSLLAAEATELSAGAETLITRLADVLVIQAIRSWIADAPEAKAGWPGALRDPQIGRTLAQIHRHPGREWTLDLLAGEAAMSRSAFASRFTELVGEPAMQYVTRWRMLTAFNLLRDENPTLADLSRRLGYESEAAFHRAFKRYIGITPGEARRRGRPQLSTV